MHPGIEIISTTDPTTGATTTTTPNRDCSDKTKAENNAKCFRGDDVCTYIIKSRCLAPGVSTLYDNTFTDTDA